ncbi:unnamed protein product [Pleuronectes platessa]|uniref:Uncharacterized protein n=1 Tax=Pleuronectes platessa TaxID=8262 RepID=A0A9N7TN57_PLEPL|nr:unnamed protein product [Pleuronectes platessa]
MSSLGRVYAVGPHLASEEPSCARGDTEDRHGPETRQQRPAEGKPRREANKGAAGAKRSREGAARRRLGGGWRPGAGAAEAGRVSGTDAGRTRSRARPFCVFPWMVRPRGQAAAPPLPRSSSMLVASQRRVSELLPRTHATGCTTDGLKSPGCGGRGGQILRLPPGHTQPRSGRRAADQPVPEELHQGTDGQ